MMRIDPERKRPSNTVQMAVLCALCVGPWACREQPTAEPAPQPAPRVAVAPPTRSLDTAQDAASTPGWFPRPNDIVGWQRSANTAAIDSAGSTLNYGRLKRLLPTYAATTILRCAFESTAPCPSGLSCEAILVKHAHSDDAFGLLVSMYDAPPDQTVGTLSGATVGDSTYLRSTWIGDYTIHVRAADVTTTADRDCIDRLAAGLAEPIPSSAPPALFSYFPSKQRLPGQAWFVRDSLDVLPQRLRSAVLGGAEAQVARDLGLSRASAAAIVAYDPGEGESANYVWLVQYPLAQDARNAVGRYKAALSHAGPAADVLIEGPIGRFVCGTWTRGQESLPNMNVMQRILTKLPK